MIEIVSKNINGIRVDFPKKVWDKVCDNILANLVVTQNDADVMLSIPEYGQYVLADTSLQQFMDWADQDKEKVALKLFELGLPLDYIKMNNK